MTKPIPHPPKRVTAAVIRDGGRILLTRRAKSRKQAGCREFPGGKIEPGEPPEKCLTRELKEELNLECATGRKLTESEYNYDHGSFIIMAYEAKIISGSITLSVHDKYEWADPEKLLSYNLSPADIPIAKHLAHP